MTYIAVLGFDLAQRVHISVPGARLALCGATVSRPFGIDDTGALRCGRCNESAAASVGQTALPAFRGQPEEFAQRDLDWSGADHGLYGYGPVD